MEPTLLVRSIQSSHFLLEQEKAYWLKALPSMNDAQVAELGSILSESGQIPQAKLEDALPLIAKATAALA